MDLGLRVETQTLFFFFLLPLTDNKRKQSTMAGDPSLDQPPLVGHRSTLNSGSHLPTIGMLTTGRSCRRSNMGRRLSKIDGPLHQYIPTSGHQKYSIGKPPPSHQEPLPFFTVIERVRFLDQTLAPSLDVTPRTTFTKENKPSTDIPHFPL